MALEPSPKQAIVFFDGQNLYHAARHAFGYTYPNFDPIALASAISNAHGWELAEVRFYTGVPAVNQTRVVLIVSQVYRKSLISRPYSSWPEKSPRGTHLRNGFGESGFETTLHATNRVALLPSGQRVGLQFSKIGQRISTYWNSCPAVRNEADCKRRGRWAAVSAGSPPPRRSRGGQQ